MKNKEANPDKFFLKNLPAFIGYVNSSHILYILILLAGGSVFTLLPSILELIAFFILYAAAYKLAVDVLIETANGKMSPGDFQSSFEAKDILIKFILVGVFQVGVLIWIQFFVKDPLILVLYIVISTFITPAVFMVLSITNSLKNALNPVTIVRLIKPWFATYLAFVGFWLALETLQIYAIEPLFAHFPSLFGSILSMFFKFYFLVLNFHIMGFLIFQNREVLGFDARFDDEYDDYASIVPVINPIYERIRRLISKGDLLNAQKIINEVKESGDNSNELVNIEHLIAIGNPDKANKPLTDAENIHQLLKENKLGSAFKIYAQMLLDNNKYSEIDAHDITQLAHYAFQAQKYKHVTDVLKFFHNKYPKHEDVMPNYFLIVQILHQNNSTKGKAKKMLLRLIRNYPNHKMATQLAKWQKGVDLMENEANF